MIRTATMIGAILLGLFVGRLIGGFVLTVIAAVGPVGPGVSIPVLVFTSLLGGFIGFLRWRRWWPDGAASDAHGSARFSREEEIARTLGGDEGLIVGRSMRGKLLRYNGPAHLLTIAPSQAGKGVGTIIPNSLTLRRSVLCVDPKGENTRITVAARARMGPVFVLDPFDVSGQPCAAFNPLSALDPDSLDLVDDVAAIAEALVYDPPNQAGEAHWNEEAKALISGVILHVVTTAPAYLRSLITVRDFLTAAPDAFAKMLKAMQDSGAAGGLVARAANRHLGKSDREAAGVLSAAQRHTHFLDSPRMARVLERSDFSLSQMQTGLVSVFLVLPPERLRTHARWLRLMVVQTIGALARGPVGAERAGPPVLLMLDEFAALGHLEPVERAFGLMAGYGLQIWAILQDLHQLKSAYGDHAGTFLANARVIQVFNVADIDTATWVSRSMGVTTEVYDTSGQSTTRAGDKLFSTHGSSTNVNLARRDLLTPDEVMRIDAGSLILLRPGANPTLALKVRYYADPEFKGLF